VLSTQYHEMKEGLGTDEKKNKQEALSHFTAERIEVRKHWLKTRGLSPQGTTEFAYRGLWICIGTGGDGVEVEG